MVKQAVVDSQSDEMNLLALDLTSVDGSVLLLKVVSEGRAVVAAIRLGEKTEVAVLVRRELGVEVLKELPDDDGSLDGRGGAVASVAEASLGRLVNVELF